MPLRRVPPGTIPREPEDRLGDFFGYQQQEMDLDLQRENPDNWHGSPGRFARPLIPRRDREDITTEMPHVQAQNISDKGGKGQELPDFSGKTPSGYWGRDSSWQQLSPYQKAAAMALLEADSSNGKPDFPSARNVLGAMINRADKDGQDLGEHVSKRIYQPTIEPTQYRRLQNIIKLPEFQALERLAEARDTGKTEDWVNGATHFLAHEGTMERLRAEDPGKYKSWPGWSGYNKGGGKYTNPDGSDVIRDRSHAFLAPEGRHSANRGPLVDRDEPPLGPDGGKPMAMAQADVEAGPRTAPADSPSEPKVKIPKLSEMLFGVDKPVLGNLLGLNLGASGAPGIGRRIAQATQQANSDVALPMSQAGSDQEMQAFGVGPLQRRQPPRQSVPKRRF